MLTSLPLLYTPIWAATLLYNRYLIPFSLTLIASSPIFNCCELTRRWWSHIRKPYSPHTRVVPLADPPVGTRGLPFRDLFFSGMVGRSQLPALTAVLENGRRDWGELWFEGAEKAVAWARLGPRGRIVLEANESLPSWAVKLCKLWGFMVDGCGRYC